MFAGSCGYLELFREARTWVQRRDAEEALIRQHLVEAALEAKLPGAADPKVLDAALTEACASVRSAAGGQLVSLGSETWPQQRTLLLNLLHAALVKAPQVWATALSKPQSGCPLRLSCDGHDHWHLYTETPGVERDPRIPEWPWVSNRIIRRSAKGSFEVVSSTMVSLRYQPGEVVIEEDFEASQSWEKTRTHLLPGVLRRALDQAEAVLPTVQVPVSDDDLLMLVRQGVEWSAKQKGRFIVRHYLQIPLGLATLGSVEHRGSYSGNAERCRISFAKGGPALLVAEVNSLWAWCWQRASDLKVKQEIETLATARHAHLEKGREHLREASAKFHLAYFSVAALKDAASQSLYLGSAAKRLSIKGLENPDMEKIEEGWTTPRRFYLGPAWQDMEAVVSACDGKCADTEFFAVHTINDLGVRWFPGLSFVGPLSEFRDWTNKVTM